MRACHPRVWLMTDERMGEALWAALRRVPPGGGVVFRHRSLAPGERLRLFVRVRRIARARGLTVVSAGGRLPGADGVHGTSKGGGLRTWPAHDRDEVLAGMRRGALPFVSPVFATRTHPGAPALGVRRAGRVAGAAGGAAIAMGGMDAARWRRISRHGFAGWAAIDAWLA